MANGMGSLFIGKSGLTMAQNAINTTSNNLANVNTTGYVREQVLFSDLGYSNLSKASNTVGSSVNMKQAGYGVTIGDVVHTRDIFLDKYYRTESGREAFYQTCYDTTTEIQELLGELQGQAFQEVLQELKESMAELSKNPSAEVNQNLVIQKAASFIERAQDLYSSLSDYQLNLNTQIRDSVDTINDLGKTIYELNKKIQQVEANGIETAMELRDVRDVALDNLAKYGNISYTEDINGMVHVKFEGVEFIDENTVHTMALRTDRATKFVTPVWKTLSNFEKQEYVDVFDYNIDISTEMNTDIGSLKALVMCRGTELSNYMDIEAPEVTSTSFADTTGLSPIETIQAQIDHLVHSLVTSINDIFSPLTTQDSITYKNEKGEIVTLNNVKVWDEANGTVGADGKGPGQELFSRYGLDRYTTIKDTSGKTWYVYNEEDNGAIEYDFIGNVIPKKTSTFYNVNTLVINPALKEDGTRLATYYQSGKVAYDIAESIVDAWSSGSTNLLPGSTKVSFADYYETMVTSLASDGNVFNSITNTLTSSVTSIVTQREQVIGVSSDEELTSLIKYQSAYNAASRFITTVDEMLEHLVTQLGS